MEGDTMTTTVPTQLISGTVVEAQIADDAVTLAKMATGTDGNLIPYDANGDPAYIATGTAAQILTSNGAGAAPTFQTPAAGGAWTLIGTSVASSSASLTVTGLDSTYDTYAIGVSALRPASNDVDLWLRLGDSGGIDSGGSDYGWAESTNGAARVSSSGDSKIKCTGDMGGAINGIGNAATEGVSGVFFLGEPADAGMYSTVYGNPSVARTTTPAVGIFMGQRQANIAHDRVQVLFQSGNITSGRLTVWGISHE